MDRYMIVIPAKNRAFNMKCDDGDSMKLETLQKLVGGPIEPVHTLLEPGWAREKDVDGILLLVNEEGRLEGLPENPRAEEMVSYAAPAHAKLVGRPLWPQAGARRSSALQSLWRRPSVPSGCEPEKRR